MNINIKCVLLHVGGGVKLAGNYVISAWADGDGQNAVAGLYPFTTYIVSNKLLDNAFITC